jgi:oxygen-independent coproporphyrinogen-3 oxidase
MNSEKEILIRKYNVPGPRYTSYPTVPYWDNDSFKATKWNTAISDIFKNDKEEISLYIHLPYCESLCTFCGCNTRITVNHEVEVPYIDTVVKEWNLYQAFMKKKPVIKEIHLGGGTPTFFSPANLERLIIGIKATSLVSLDAELGFEGHPNNTTKEHLQSLYNLGFRRVSFGIQDFDTKVQEVINRIQSYEKVKAVTEAARYIGYTSINFDIVYGLPLQKLESIVDTIEKVNQLKPDRIAFYSYAHVPWIKPGQRKFTELDLPDDDVKRNLYETGRNMLELAGYEEIGMDHFALKTDSLYKASINKTLHRNFMGYTSSRTSRLIGLGVSSISDLWGAYAQNVKTVEEYKTIVNEGRIPVFRGHFLSNEDLILRQHILNIMCKLETSWSNPGEQCMALFDGLGNMRELEKDGLLEIGLSSLHVTEKGRPFIRNICMALDARMSDKSKKEIQFSKVI